MGTDAGSINKLYTTIARLRQEGLSDAAVTSVLRELGLWDEGIIAVALGAPQGPQPAVPLQQDFRNDLPIGEATPPTSSLAAARPEQSISPVAATFHHISLWFFMGVTIPAVAILVSALFGSSFDDLSTLTSFIATAGVTGVVYGVFYGVYLKKALAFSGTLVPNKIFSIISMAFALVLTMGALITFLVSLINSSWSEDLGAVLLASALLAGIGLAIMATYWAAAILPATKSLRKPLLFGGPAIIAAILVGLLIATVASLPNAAADAQTERDLVKTVQAIETYSDDEGALPSEDDYRSLAVAPDITYEQTDRGVYELCAQFKTDTLSEYSSSYVSPNGASLDSSYVYEGNFSEHKLGKQCFTVENYELSDPYLSDQPLQSEEELREELSKLGTAPFAPAVTLEVTP